MHPNAFSLPGGIQISSYGFCLAVAFFTGTLIAWWWAKRANLNTEIIPTTGVLAALGGVGGARLFFVIHYWESYAGRPNLLLNILDVRAGLEFLGGFLLGTVVLLLYLLFPRRVPGLDGRRQMLPVRTYLDVLTLGLVWGLAITRLGCFLNGCCFGSTCNQPGDSATASPLAMTFPYGSPPYNRQWSEGVLAVPEELTYGSGPGDRLIPVAALETAASESKMPAFLQEKLQEPSSTDPSKKMTLAELSGIARASRSLPVHPTQLYASIHAFLLYFLLVCLFKVRRRHGLVFVAMLMLYPVARFLLESIRADNPRDMGGLTASQVVSLFMFSVGGILLILLYRLFPPNPSSGVAATGRTNPTPSDRESNARGRKRRRRGRRSQ